MGEIGIRAAPKKDNGYFLITIYMQLIHVTSQKTSKIIINDRIYIKQKCFGESSSVKEKYLEHCPFLITFLWLEGGWDILAIRKMDGGVVVSVCKVGTEDRSHGNLHFVHALDQNGPHKSQNAL